jgi:hypothetical protein
VTACLSRVFILRGFESMALERRFGSNRDKVIESWRKLHNEELHNIYTSPNIFIMIKSGG